ncbi:hypothetical protein BDV32DRAFT_5674 [Aspergillus pseudonomiae]|nr:hypothetical protein BDV32DRAFT_5674 [Aspergillus pseudonomiae]
MLNMYVPLDSCILSGSVDIASHGYIVVATSVYRQFNSPEVLLPNPRWFTALLPILCHSPHNDREPCRLLVNQVCVDRYLYLHWCQGASKALLGGRRHKKHDKKRNYQLSHTWRCLHGGISWPNCCLSYEHLKPSTEISVASLDMEDLPTIRQVTSPLLSPLGQENNLVQGHMHLYVQPFQRCV